MRKRGEMVERSFAHVLDRGGMRRAWVRGRENVQKRYLIHVAAFNLGILMRALFGHGTPREAASVTSAILFVIQSDASLAIAVVVNCEGKSTMLGIVRRLRNGLIKARLRHRPITLGDGESPREARAARSRKGRLCTTVDGI